MESEQKFIIASVQEEEEEVVDKKEEIEQACMETKECSPVKARLDACTERVNADPEGGENCLEEFFDLMHCVNQCAPERLFHHLK